RKDRLKKHVFLLGHKDDAAQYLKAFDVFMLPSTKEGLSYTLLEARSAGIPIVSTNIGGTPEIVKDTSGLIVPAKDPEKLAEAIEMLLSNPINLQSDKDDLKNMLEATISLY
ncbi:MAG: glycosyltransferase family 1 protein, partial [Candidatus Taylorbacteria bacterium CG10_big_fil_rev_8_21_14_0_10_41_48]